MFLFCVQQPLSLCLAVQSEDVQRVQQLLEENEVENHNLVDQRNEHSHAPLHIACTTRNMYVCMFQSVLVLQNVPLYSSTTPYTAPTTIDPRLIHIIGLVAASLCLAAE